MPEETKNTTAETTDGAGAVGVDGNADVDKDTTDSDNVNDADFSDGGADAPKRQKIAACPRGGVGRWLRSGGTAPRYELDHLYLGRDHRADRGLLAGLLHHAAVQRAHGAHLPW